jgi:hypothetical protein
MMLLAMMLLATPLFIVAFLPSLLPSSLIFAVSDAFLLGTLDLSVGSASRTS